MLFTDVLSGGDGGGSFIPTTITITGDTTLTQHFDIVEIDTSSNDVEVKLPDNTSLFVGKSPTLFTHVNDITNVNNVAKVTAETPNNLVETNQEIILDIELSASVYLSSSDSKYRSTNGFSENRIQQLLPRSTGCYIPSFDNANYASINTTAQTWNTGDINLPGGAWIYDRSKNITASAGTQVSGVEVTFTIPNNKLKKGQFFKATGWTPAAYNSVFPAVHTVKSVSGDLVTVDLLSDPGGNATVVGTVSIIDRDMVPRPCKISWTAQIGLDDAGGAGIDGNFITHVGIDGTITTEDIKSLSILPTYNGVSGTNSNTHVQILQFNRESGSIDSINAALTTDLNVGKRVDEFEDSLGTIANATDPIILSFNGANLNLDFSTGRGLVRATGLLGNPGGQAPDTEVAEVATTQATILTILRDNTILSVSTSVDTTLIEDPNNPGSTSAMGNNTAKVNKYKFLPTEKLALEYLGESTSGTIAIAIAKKEAPNFPSLGASALITEEVALDEGETILDGNAEIVDTNRVDLT